MQQIITRAQWGANPRSLPAALMRLPATAVSLHHTVTPISADPADDVRAVESIGMQRFGQMSYNFLIHPHDGEIYEGAGLRRGAHISWPANWGPGPHG